LPAEEALRLDRSRLLALVLGPESRWHEKGHEKKDRLSIPLLLQRHRVSRFWLIWPEEQALIAHRLDEDGYRVIATLTPTERGRARVPPFEEPDGVLARGWRS
jgi:hypothetical protein